MAYYSAYIANVFAIHGYDIEPLKYGWWMDLHVFEFHLVCQLVLNLSFGNFLNYLLKILGRLLWWYSSIHKHARHQIEAYNQMPLLWKLKNI